MPEKNSIVDIIRAEWDPNYKADLWCGVCVARMIELAFNNMDAEADTEIVKVKF